MDTISLLQSAALEAALLRREPEPATDQVWKLNYTLLVNPPVQCPWCSEWVPTRRVWVVDEGERKVRRVWTLAGRPLEVERCHPHVGTAGAICMGNARSAVEALTAGLSSDAYVKPAEWLPEIGHECDEMGGALQGQFTCYSCDWIGDEDDFYWSYSIEERYCEECYYENHTSCERCGDTFYTRNGMAGMRETPRGWYCEECFDERYAECVSCDTVVTHDESYSVDYDSYCSDCYHEQYESCDNCSEDFARLDNALEEGLCEECRPEPEPEDEEEEEESLTLESNVIANFEEANDE